MKRSIFFLLFASIGLVATAQTINKERLIDECQRLYSDGEYTTALSLLEKLDIEKLDKERRQEAELLIALNKYETDALAGRSLMLQYLADYPESTQRKLLSCYIAQSYYLANDYENACEWFGKCDFKLLAAKQREEATLHYALSLINTGNEGTAEKWLREIKLDNNLYAADATFHLAVMDYNRDMLDAAHNGFESVKRNKKYFFKVPYYQAGILIKKGDYQEALKIANRFIGNNGDSIEDIKMHQMLGAAHFMKGDYKKAAEALAIYVNANKNHSPQRIALYQLGKSLYEIGNYDEAITMFIEIVNLSNFEQENDAIVQNAYLHIGLIHLENDNVKDALRAFEMASGMRFDDRVREEALYNYAMCIHATNYSPFGESVRIFEQFINDYPNSKHADKVGEFLVEEYTNTHNYEIALQSINKISAPSEKILDAKKKMLYNIGVQEFVNGDMNNAISYFDQSIALCGKNDNEIKGSALFWKGEALFRQGKINAARKSYEQALGANGNGNSKAIYGIGYTYFKEKEYGQARNKFLEFEKVANMEEVALLADTYSRIADCNFYQRSFDQAEEYYTKSVNTCTANADYPLYRLAQIQSLKNNRSESVATLETLLSKYPNSPRTEEALYELGRSYIKLEKYDEAISTYDKLINDRRFENREDLVRRASAERAMIYNTLGQSDSAIAAYKRIIEVYPDSEEAQVAMQDLKSIYVDLGKVDLYAEYALTTKGEQMIDGSEIDKLAYTAAEKIYARGDLDGAKVAFDDYLKNYPNGAYRINSYYYKGMISYNQDNEDDALACFEQVYNHSSNKYSEDALVLAAEIHYGRMDFDKSTPLYMKIAAQSKKEERRNTALKRVLHASTEQNKHNDVIQYATKIEKSTNIPAELKREAIFCRAKAYLALNDNDHAIDDLDLLAEDTRTKEGAEAKYLVAQLLFDEQSYDFCEDEINDFIEMGTPHTYWMARSFILLADLYIVQGKTMDAKQYLLSLQNNYKGDDDIAGMITERLSKISNKNKKK